MHSVDFGKYFTHSFKPYLAEKISITDDIAVFVADDPSKHCLVCVCLTLNNLVLSFVYMRE